MAEIHIERKRGVSPLVWILLLIVLAAIAWFAYNTYVKDGTNPTIAPAATTSSVLHAAADAATT